MGRSPRIAPTQAELDKSVEDIIYVMYQCSSFFVWSVYIKPKVGLPPDDVYVTTVHNAILEANLLFIRKLNEFFKDRPNVDEKDDDLRAYDFPGFKDVGTFLPPDDYEQLHKRVGHMTLKGVREGKVSWEIHHAVKLAITKSIRFLDYLADDLYVSNSAGKHPAVAAKGALQRLSAEMDKVWAIERPNG